MMIKLLSTLWSAVPRAEMAGWGLTVPDHAEEQQWENCRKLLGVAGSPRSATAPRPGIEQFMTIPTLPSPSGNS
ncbi:unnamed protein product [Caretta caretta]